MRHLVRKLGYFQVMVLITLSAIISAEILAYVISEILSFPYPVPSTPVVTFLVTALVTPFISWHLLDLLFKIDKMEQIMHDLAMYDSMTKLLSRQAFFKRSLALHDMCASTQQSYTVAIIDIDDFKSINDTYGHAYGDKILIEFGEVILKVLDASYVIGRIGGEEFALLLNIDKNTMKQEMDKVHQGILDSKVPYKGSSIKYTISIGIFENKTPNTLTFDEALSHADHALYDAKVTGKNKSVIFSKALSNNNILRKASNLRSRKY
ncbi:MAG TPA: GGDEF domain-containing protein [Epsilonproteobacteria bacterium]|nr:GGDEF domain-containing protein [Campylobacterota bacterium]